MTHDETAQDPSDPSTPTTEITESDPNADGPEGLAGDMGVSSERLGTVRGGGEPVTYTSAPTYPSDAEVGAPSAEDSPPEQSSRDGRPDVQPDPVEPHASDPDRNPRHGV